LFFNVILVQPDFARLNVLLLRVQNTTVYYRATIRERIYKLMSDNHTLILYGCQ